MDRWNSVTVGCGLVAAVLLSYQLAHSAVSQANLKPMTRSQQIYSTALKTSGVAPGAPATVTAAAPMRTSHVSGASLSKVTGSVGVAAVSAMTLCAVIVNIFYRQRSAHTTLLAEQLALAATTSSKERPVWFPGTTPAPHLTGQYPGDRGFDPVDFSVDPATFERMRASEVFHGRLAMLGAAGCLIPELLGKGAWFKAGETVDLAQLGLIGMLCMFPLEYWRGNGGFGWGQNEKQKGDRIYPGFDPMKMTSDDTKTKEIKNGRLAMLACLGLFSQAYITGASPLENLGL